MLPTSSSTDLVGTKVRSATALINGFCSSGKVARLKAAHSLRHGRARAQPGTGAMASDRCWRPVEGGMLAQALTPRITSRSCAMLAGVGATLALSACGGGQSQAVHEPRGTFTVDVRAATFPAAQQISQHTHLVIAVRNSGHKTIPDVAVTVCNVTCAFPAPTGEGTSVAAFASSISQSYVANPSRPNWIVQRGPGRCGDSCRNGGQGAAVTAYSNTWALGKLGPGRTARFDWALTAVAAGRHTVAWQVAAGLNGKARAVLSNGAPPHGIFVVHVSSAPPRTSVNNNGQIVNAG